VDDAIVVVEVVERHIEEGMTPRDAALTGIEEVSGPVIATALILVAVFVPTIFISGITGRLYEQFAVTIAVSIVLSAFNALSLSPAMAALLLRPRRESHGPLARFFGWFNRTFNRARERYIGLSALLIRKAALSVLFLVVVMGAAYLVFGRLPTSFVPEEDEGYIYVNLQLPNSASQQRTEAAAHQAADIIMHTPGVQGVTSVIGFSLLSFSQQTYNAFFFVTLKPWSERTAANEQINAIEANITRELAKVTAGSAFTFPPPAIPGVGTSGGVTFILEDRSNSGTSFLAENVDKFLAALHKRKELAAVNSTFLPAVPQQYADVDRVKVQRQQVNIGDVYETLQTFLGGYLVNYFNLFGRQWQVYVEAEGDYRTRPDDIKRYYVFNSSGTMVPLSSVTAVHPVNGPEFVLRYNEYESAQINAIVAPGYSSGQAMKALEDTFAATMPREMGYGWEGMSFQEQLAAQGISALTVFGVSLLFVFLLLAALYESWSLPFSVLLSTPIAVFGATLALWGRHFDNDVYAQIGLVMLIGLSAKNAILIVEFAKKSYESGTSAEEAALNGARIRLRPILMTAFAFILGVIPLWIATGAGAVSRRILGTTVIGGMLAASLIAIFIIPVNFYVVETLTHRFRGRRRT
jgi:hydrophobic/amphiphilic exporter-1 (mainly G- bacteria), HAE1 family